MAGPKKTAPKSTKASTAEYKTGDTILCKIKGYPYWPSKVVDLNDVGADVVKEKPQKGDHFCVRFYPKGDFAWTRARDCKPLPTEDIKAFVEEPHRKSGEMLEAYKIALDPSSWEAELAEAMRAHEEAMEGVDELEDDEDGEDEVGTASGAKKRKKTAAPAKDAKGKKAKVEKKAKAPASKKGSKVKSNPNIESEEEAEPEKAKSSAKKAADDLDADSAKVKDWRHKLQRAFLGKAPPAEKDMPNCDQYFSTIEAYDDMTIEQLQASKIGKVMRKIQALDSIPRDEDFHFKERAKKLMDKWQAQLNKAGATEDAAPAPTNGASTSAAESKKDEASPAPAAAKEDEAPATIAEEKKAEEGEEAAPAPEAEATPAAAADEAKEEVPAKEESKKTEDVEMGEPATEGDDKAAATADTEAAADAPAA